MKALIPVLTLRAVGTRFSMLRNRAIWRCWLSCGWENQPSFVMLTMKSARLFQPPSNIRATSRGSASSKQIGTTKREPRPPSPTYSGERAGERGKVLGESDVVGTMDVVGPADVVVDADAARPSPPPSPRGTGEREDGSRASSVNTVSASSLPGTRL